MESELQLLKQSVATETDYGLAKITESSTVTEKDSGLVLSAREKNPAVDGTIGNSIEKIRNAIKKKTYYRNSVKLNTKSASGAWYTALSGFYSENRIDPEKVISISVSEFSYGPEVFSLMWNTERVTLFSTNQIEIGRVGLIVITFECDV